LRAAGAADDIDGEHVEVAGRVHVIEAFAEAVDENAGIGGPDIDFRIGQVAPVKGNERCVGFLAAQAVLTEGGAALEAAPGHGVNGHLAEKSAWALCDADE
jgi:hypothetical protein